MDIFILIAFCIEISVNEISVDPVLRMFLLFVYVNKMGFQYKKRFKLFESEL